MEIELTYRFHLTLATLAGLTFAALPMSAAADENLLGYTVGAETLPKGASEAYFWLTDHSGKRRGSYSAQYLRAEYEYGITNSLSGAIYLNGYRHSYDCGTVGCAGPVGQGEITGSLHRTQLSGFSLELKKMLLSPYKDDLGVALYGEVTYDTVDPITGEKGQGYEVEAKLILQRPYLDGQLQWVTNLELEAESWRPQAGGGTEFAVAPRLRSGVSYRFAPNWSIGAEGWIDAEILRPAGESWQFDHWDFFAGPSLHYGGKTWWATLTWAQQLRGSNEAADNVSGLHLADHERREIRLKLGYNF
ncbi:hypothetical protein Ga0061069_10865 [Thiomonas bhubaneswarensis]|uniref:MetA-pathway of phenol degradation n=1 Tax=Thiomonas bhubaneswarensis TaxID=339866 RepID=A0A0K6I704_9BURK|nr:hypothetical protein Ga0061069_10865 [Thiomonas bhubaneswarensis]